MDLGHAILVDFILILFVLCMWTICRWKNCLRERKEALEDFEKDLDKWKHLTRTYECKAVLMKEPDGGYSIVATRLLGVASQGDTEAEAIENIKEAFAGAIEIYLESGEIPWSTTDEPIDHDGEKKEVWVMVEV